MRKTFLLFLFMIVGVMADAQSYLYTKPSNGSGLWSKRDVKLVHDLPGFSPLKEKEDINRYGSSSLIKEKATGFFYTKKIAGRWWVIDPDGYAGINIAMNSVYNINPKEDIPVMYDRFKRLGYNGIGNFLNNEEQTNEYNEGRDTLFSYTRKINFFLTYKDKRRMKYPSTPIQISGSTDYVFVMDPEFETYCDELAKKMVLPYRNERNLIGYFLDNEINFNQDQLGNMLNGKLKKGDPSFDAALAFITERGYTQEDVQSGEVPESVKEEFAVMLAEHYYKVTAAAIKKYDPNHLNLGSRLHGRPRGIEGVVKASARYCDIVSVNFYDRFSPDDQITSPDLWLKWIDAPCVVTEFYTKGYDATTNGYVNGYSGAGWVVKNQVERGYFYQNTCLQLLKSKQFIGWHYFKFQDDSNSNKGIYTVSAKGRLEYTELTSLMRELNINVYKLIDYFDKGASDVQVSVIKPTDDTYIYSDVIHGMEEFLLTYHSTAGVNFRRETYLKFDLAGLSPYLENVKLQMYAEKLEEGHQFDLYPVKLNTWAEDGVMFSDQTQKFGGNLNTLLASCIVPEAGVEAGYLSWNSETLKKLISDSIAQGSRYVSFRLREKTSVKDKAGKGAIVRFHSKENLSGFTPKLIVESKEMKHLYAKMIYVDGKGIDAFGKSCFRYMVHLPWNSTLIPTLTAEAQDASIAIDITSATDLKGNVDERTSTIKLTDGKDVVTYFITFELMSPPTNATISDIMIQNKSLKGFDKEKNDYVFYLPYSSTQVPAVQAVPTDPNAKVEYTYATDIIGNKASRTTVISCTSANGEIEKKYTVEFIQLPEMDLFLALGQSNMSGRASYAGYQEPLQDVYLLNEFGEVEIATNPMNQYSNIRKDLGLQGLSPAYSFCLKVQQEVQKPIGIMVNAQGGSSIALWNGKGKANYDASLKRAKELQRFGKIKGIIWHQGSSDNSNGLKDSFVSYKNSMSKMVESFRSDLNESDLIFICADLADRSDFNEFNKVVVRAVAEYIPFSTFVTAEGTKLLADNTHFDTESNILLGERYADKYLNFTPTSMYNPEMESEFMLQSMDNYLMITNKGEMKICNIYNIQGILMKRIVVEKHTEISVPFGKGLYIVELMDKKHRILQKVVL